MGFWNKLGKIALQAAPYVAAPFTAGASLYAVPATKQLGQKWAESDARKAQEKGLGPSRFDRILGGISDVTSMASSMGTPGISGGKNAPSTTFGKNSGGGGWSDRLGDILGGGNEQWKYRTPDYNPNARSGSARIGGGYGGNYADGGDTDYIQDAISGVDRSGRGGGSSWIDKLGGAKGIGAIAGGVGGAFALKKILENRSQNNEEKDNYDYTRGGAPTYGGDRFARQMRRQLGPVMGQSDQNFPNLAESIGSGRMDAMRDQPFRGGYDVRNISGYDEDKNPEYEYTQMPRIGPNYRQRQQEYTGPQTEPTPRRSRRREAEY